MGARRIAAVALSAALLAGGTGAAIAAVTKDEGENAEQAVLDDAAKRLSVTPEKLREALTAAQDAQLDRAVKDGELTRRQADKIKAARKRSGRVLGPFAGPRPHKRFAPGTGRPGMRLRGGPLGADLAKALGTTPASCARRCALARRSRSSRRPAARPSPRCAMPSRRPRRRASTRPSPTAT